MFKHKANLVYCVVHQFSVIQYSATNQTIEDYAYG